MAAKEDGHNILLLFRKPPGQLRKLSLSCGSCSQRQNSFALNLFFLYLAGSVRKPFRAAKG